MRPYGCRRMTTSPKLVCMHPARTAVSFRCSAAGLQSSRAWCCIGPEFNDTGTRRDPTGCPFGGWYSSTRISGGLQHHYGHFMGNISDVALLELAAATGDGLPQCGDHRPAGIVSQTVAGDLPARGGHRPAHDTRGRRMRRIVIRHSATQATVLDLLAFLRRRRRCPATPVIVATPLLLGEWVTHSRTQGWPNRKLRTRPSKLNLDINSAHSRLSCGAGQPVHIGSDQPTVIAAR